jgi:fatty acid kinase fatty acid binding subunit
VPRVAIVIDGDACVPRSLREALGIRCIPPDPPPLAGDESVAGLSLEARPPDPEPVARACAEAAAEAGAVLYLVAGDGFGSAPEAAPLARAAVAARAPGARFVAEDSESSLMGTGWQAVAAARALAAGADLDGALAAARAVREAVTVLAVLEHPELSGVAGANLPGTANLRAVVELSGAAVEVVTRQARRDASLVLLRDQVEALAAPPGGALHVAVHHAAAAAGAEALATWLRRALAPAELIVEPITRHAATRLGPRMIGVAWYREPA